MSTVDSNGSARERLKCLLIQYQGVAEITGFSKKTISRYWKRGEMPAPKRIGGKLVWRLEDILKWIDELGSGALPSGRKRR